MAKKTAEHTVVIATAAEAIDVARKVKGQFVTLTMRTKQTKRMKAANRPPKGQDVWKVASMQARPGVEYSNCVENQRVREGVEEVEAFEAQETWGESIEGTSLIRHNGNIYLGCKHERNIEHHYEDDNGNIIPNDEVEPYLYKRNKSGTQSVEKEVRWIRPMISSIIGIAYGGITYVITENLHLVQDLAAIKGVDV